MAIKPKNPSESAYNITHQFILNRAAYDPKYAEFQRRETVKDVKSTKESVAQLKNIITKLKADQIKESKTVTTLANRLITLDANNDNVVDNNANLAEFNTKTTALKKAKNQVDSTQKAINTSTSSLAQEEYKYSQQSSLLAKLDSITGVTSNTLIKGGSTNQNNNNNNAGPTSALGEILFNAPMMKSAYFSSNSIQTALTRAGINTPYKMTNAQNDAFKQPGTRGAIQMNADTAKYLKQKFTKTKGQTQDPNAYGFSFHYNPTAISMSYGQMQDVSPELLQGGEGLKFNPITPLGVGGFSFELYLNRIDDLNYLQSDGTLSMQGSKKASDTQMIPISFSDTDLYPTPVSLNERKTIYRKGTMYDLEYLFRAVHGGSNDYTSLLRGRTSDIGWIAGVAVEFHLGDNLRFLGRINGVTVNHVLFNERMVPMLSVIRVEASRFYDIPGVVGKSAPATSGANR